MGWGGRGKRIAQNIIKKNTELEVVAWVDTNRELQGTELFGKKIYAPENISKFMSETNVKDIVMTIRFMSIYELGKQIKEMNLKDVYFVPDTYLMPEYEKTGKDLLVKVDISKPIIGYFEYHVCDHCNLNCLGCGHVSNISEKWAPTLESFEQDLQDLTRLFGMVAAIKLLGGEPLLNPELPEFIKIARKYYPGSEIYVGTNGLLIPSCDDKLLKTMKENDIYFMISNYPVFDRIQKRVVERLERFGIPMILTNRIDEFYNVRMKNPESDIVKAHEACFKRNGRCFTVREGKINPCVISYIRMLNEKFHINFEITGRDEFDLQKETDGWELAEKLHNPIPMCAYCGTPEAFTWKCGVTHAALEDYVISDDAGHAIS